MKIIISPAKKMRVDTDSLPWETLPRFLPETEELQAVLQTMSAAQLQQLWRCNTAIAELNRRRHHNMNLREKLTPAILAYEGLQYQYLAPGVLEREPLAYIQGQLRILSGFYGILRPFDGVTPYRLEMQAKLSVNGHRDLYRFWGSRLADCLYGETDCILDLASKEYSRAVIPHLPKGIRLVSCCFGEQKDGKLVEKGTLCKMARGEMLRFLAAEGIETPEGAKAFKGLGYEFSAVDSTRERYVFLRTK